MVMEVVDVNPLIFSSSIIKKRDDDMRDDDAYVEGYVMYRDRDEVVARPGSHTFAGPGDCLY